MLKTTRLLSALLLTLALGATSFAQSPPQGSGAAGVAAWIAANCSAGQCTNPATTANGQFTIELLSVTTAGSLVTFEYETCQIAGQNALSHWTLSMAGIDCLAPGASLGNLVVAASMNGVATTSYSIGLDPTTQVNGFKFDLGATASCDTWAITFDTTYLAAGMTLGTGPTLAVTKAGNQSITNPSRPVPGYACVEGPVCTPALGTIGSFVWRDSDCDGIQDPTETGMKNLTVQLLKQSDLSVVDTTTTDANGFYSFTNVPAGDYIVLLTYNQISYALTANGLGGDANLDSDFDPMTSAATLTLGAGDIRNDIDAGLCVTCPGPPATQVSYPCGYDPINDPVLTVGDLIPGEPVELGFNSNFAGATGFIFYSIGPVTPFNLAGCTFYVDVLNQDTNVFLAASFFVDAAGDWTFTTADTLPLAYLGIEVIFQGRICAPNGFPGPFAPLPDFFSNAVVATIGCP